MSEFDQYALEYQKLVDQSIAVSGLRSDYFADYKRKALQPWMPAHKNARVLDYGCGIGLLTERLGRAWPEVTVHGYDPSRDSLARASHVVRDLENVRLLDEPDGEYDLVVCANVLHHVLPEDRSKVMSDLVSRLAPGGRAVVFEHNPYNPLTRKAVAACPFDEGVVLLHRREVEGLFRNAGASLIRSDYIVFFPGFMSALLPLEAWLGWLPLGAQSLVVAERAR